MDSQARRLDSEALSCSLVGICKWIPGQCPSTAWGSGDWDGSDVLEQQDQVGPWLWPQTGLGQAITAGSIQGGSRPWSGEMLGSFSVCFCFLVVSFSGFDIRVILSLHNEFGRFLPLQFSRKCWEELLLIL